VVSTIKPSRPEEGYSVVVQGRRFFTRQTSLKELIGYAYMMNVRQIVGGPGWMELDKFDVEAETDRDGKLTQPVARAMVQLLLAERFRLAMHPDRRELAVYAVTASEAPKLTKSAGNEYGFGTVGFRMFGQMEVVNATMTEFANMLQRYVLDRPVLDQTGIEGRYDLKLDWTGDDSQFNGRGGQMPKPDRGFEPPDIFTAFREQLGLRLVAKRDLAPVVVVDRVERPGEN
jgi:uncharacterized protein (TIGR03435 family)